MKMGGQAYSNYKASKSADQGLQYQQEKNYIINNEDSKLNKWYDRNYNADSTQRSDAQKVLNYTTERIKQLNKAAAGTAAVMGSTDESVAAEKAANASSMAEAASKVAAAGASRKDSIDATYLQGMENIAGQRLAQQDKMSDIEKNRASQIAKAGSALGGLNLDVSSLVKGLTGSGKD